MPTKSSSKVQKKSQNLLKIAYSGKTFFGHSSQEVFPTSITEEEGKYLQSLLEKE